MLTLPILPDLRASNGLRPMLRDESQAMIQILCMEERFLTFKTMDQAPWFDEPIVKIMVARLQHSPHADKEVDWRLPLWFAALTGGVPGTAVIWAYDLKLAIASATKPFSMNDWVHRYPMGIPTEATLSAFWSAQKDLQAGGNWLDRPAMWE